MPSTKTAKQIAAAKKRRSTTLKKYDKINKQIETLEDQSNELQKKMKKCYDSLPSELSVTKKEWKKLEAPCKKIGKQMHKVEKDAKKLLEKSVKLEEKVGEIEHTYGIHENEPY
jgi:predicted  nucleic acid-binding Zn-ribbon protein